MMEAKKIRIDGIPSIIWGKPSDRVYIFVHGKMSCKESAEAFAQIAEKKGYQTISFDLPQHGERTDSNYRCDIWNGKRDLEIIADYVWANWCEAALFACSIGAFFSLHTYGDRPLTKCLFQSPIIDMEYLIRQMFLWFNVSEERLEQEREIDTPIDILSWDYFQYVLANPIKEWNIPTAILYGAKDNLQPIEVIKRFSDEHKCELTVSESSEHPFMGEGDGEVVEKWMERCI